MNTAVPAHSFPLPAAPPPADDGTAASSAMPPGQHADPASLTQPAAVAPPTMAPRTRLILTGPVLPTLLKLAAPNILVMTVQAVMSTIDAFYLGWRRLIRGGRVGTAESCRLG